MKHIVLGAAASLGLLASTITSVHAAPLTPGIPGTTTCPGQTMAYIAQFGKNANLHGVAGFADLSGLSPQELQRLVNAYCAAR
jgi:hypothetical protein